MMLKIAWRNIWRNRRRSLIVCASMIVGVVAIMLDNGLGNAFIFQMLDNQIEQDVAHIQVHKAGFVGNEQIQFFIDDPQRIDSILAADPDVKYFSKRVRIFGLVSSANSSDGTTITGVEPAKEPFITNISRSVVRGTYLTGRRGEILISEATAAKLEVDVGDKLVLMASTPDSSVANDLYHVCGIYRTSGTEFDKVHVFISVADAGRSFSLGGKFHEYAIITNDMQTVGVERLKLEAELGPSCEVQTYEDLLPLIMMYIKNYESFVYIFYMIIGLAVLFGIINTMLMSVFERVQEFGILMSLGMKTGRIFSMVVLEALLLGITGTIIGLGAGFLIYLPLNHYGLDLAVFSKSLNWMGLASVIHPELNYHILLNSIFVMPLTAVIGAIYPAIRAVRLQPTDAMHYI